MSNISTEFLSDNLSSISSGTCCTCEDAEETQFYAKMKKIKKPLFFKEDTPVSSAPVATGVANIIPLTKYEYYGVTFNPCPGWKCNLFDKNVKNSNVKQKYTDHSFVIQEKIIKKIVDNFLKNNPSFSMHANVYEICPKAQQIHLHALFSCPVSPVEHKYEMITYFSKYCPKGNRDWRTIHVDELLTRRDKERWIEYLQKTLTAHL